MKLSKKEKLLILELGHGRTTTARWRLFVPLEIKGLAEVDKDEAKVWSSMWGVTCATVTLTERGRMALSQVDSEAEIWRATANEHATTEAAKGGKGHRCLCHFCMAAWRMRPVAA